MHRQGKLFLQGKTDVVKSSVYTVIRIYKPPNGIQVILQKCHDKHESQRIKQTNVISPAIQWYGFIEDKCVGTGSTMWSKHNNIIIDTIQMPARVFYINCIEI